MILGLAGLLYANPAVAQETITLRMKPASGQVSRYRQEMKSWMEMPGMPQAANGEPFMTMIMHTTETVKGVTGEIVDVSITTDSVRVIGPMGDMGPEFGRMLRGTAIAMQRNTRGHILSMKISAPNLPADARGPLDQMSAASRRGSFTFPEAPIAVGATWADSQEVAPGSSMKMAYRLDRIDRSTGRTHATFSSSGTASGRGSMALNGKVNSEFTLDITSGRLVKFRMEMNGATNAPQAPEPIPTRMVITTTLVP